MFPDPKFVTSPRGAKGIHRNTRVPDCALRNLHVFLFGIVNGQDRLATDRLALVDLSDRLFDRVHEVARRLAAPGFRSRGRRPKVVPRSPTKSQRVLRGANIQRFRGSLRHSHVVVLVVRNGDGMVKHPDHE
jgi:hypothetical protein